MDRPSVTTNPEPSFSFTNVARVGLLIVILGAVLLPVVLFIGDRIGQISTGRTLQNIPATAGPAGPVRQLLLADQFNSNKGDWLLGKYTGDRADDEREIANGMLRFTADIKVENTAAWILIPELSEENFGLEFDATIKEASSTGPLSIAVAFRYIDVSNFYLVRFSQNRFRIDVVVNNQWKEVTGWTPDPYTLFEKGATNRFDIFAQDSVITIFTNGKLVFSTSDDSLKEPGRLFMGVDSTKANETMTLEIDNVVIVNR